MHFMIQGGAEAHRGEMLRDGKPLRRRRRGTGLGCCCDRRGGMGLLAGKPAKNAPPAGAMMRPGSNLSAAARPTPPKKVVTDPPKKITAASARAATKASLTQDVTPRAPAPPASSPNTDSILAPPPGMYANANASSDLYGKAPTASVDAPAFASDLAPVTTARSVTTAASPMAVDVKRAAKKKPGKKGNAGLTKGQRLRAAGRRVPTLGQKIRAAFRPRPVGDVGTTPPPAAVLEQPSPAGIVPADQTGDANAQESFISEPSSHVSDPGSYSGFTANASGGDEYSDDGVDDGGPGSIDDDGGDAGDIDDYGDDENLYADADADADLYGEGDDSEMFDDAGDDDDGGAHLSGFADDQMCRMDQMGIRRCPREEALFAGAVGTPIINEPSVSATGAISLWGGNGDDELFDDSFDTLQGLGLLGKSNIGDTLSEAGGKISDVLSKISGLLSPSKPTPKAAASAHAESSSHTMLWTLLAGSAVVGTVWYLARKKKGRRR